MRTIILLALAALVVGCGDDGPAQVDAGNNTTADASTNPRVAMVTTVGTMVFEVYEDEMPITSANFFRYVDTSWLDGTLIHRVQKDRIFQGGGFTSGLQSKTPLAPIPLETSAAISHVHGALSMARDPANPNSASSQWFVVDWPATGEGTQPGKFDGVFAAFGVLVEGHDVLEAISNVPVETVGTRADVPVTEVVVTSVRRQ